MIIKINMRNTLLTRQEVLLLLW